MLLIKGLVSISLKLSYRKQILYFRILYYTATLVGINFMPSQATIMSVILQIHFHLFLCFIQAHVDMALRNNNQWKEHALVLKFPHSACSAFRTNMPDFFRIIFKSLGGDYMDARKKCFIPGVRNCFSL